MVAAAITAGNAVALAVINRALTDDCLASCHHGYVCDHEAGICVLPSELKVPPRPWVDPDDWYDGCIEEDDGTWLCPDDPPPSERASEPTDAGTARAADPCPTPCPDGGPCQAGDAGTGCAGEDLSR